MMARMAVSVGLLISCRCGCQMKTVAVFVVSVQLLFGYAADLSADEVTPTEKRELVATVLGTPIYQFTPADAAMERKKLSELEY